MPFCPGEEPYQSYVQSDFSKAFLADRAIILASKYWESGRVPDTFKWLAEIYSDIQMIDSFTGEPLTFITAANGPSANTSGTSVGTKTMATTTGLGSRKKSNALLHDQYPLTSDIPLEWGKSEPVRVDSRTESKVQGNLERKVDSTVEEKLDEKANQKFAEHVKEKIQTPKVLETPSSDQVNIGGKAEVSVLNIAETARVSSYLEASEAGS